MTILNALSIDLEDWFHAELVRTRLTGERPERRVAWTVEPILVLLERYETRATFFIVGDVLRHHPDLVQRIYQAGHEIGCHGWSHRPLWSLDPERFAWELDTFDQEAERILPVQEIIGFRAPTFSIDQRTSWAIDVLQEHGFSYDSSIFPVRNYLYGIDDAPPAPYRIASGQLDVDSAQGKLIEFPMTAFRQAGFSIPISGGFYMRAMPWPVMRRLLSWTNDRGLPFVIYLHPWEADISNPRIKGISPLTRFVTYYNLGSTLHKLEALLQQFELGPLRDVLGVSPERAAS